MSETFLAALERARGTKMRRADGAGPTIEDRILDVMDESRDTWTADELAARLDLSTMSVRSRTQEMLKAGLLAYTGERRPSSRGGKSKVFRRVVS